MSERERGGGYTEQVVEARLAEAGRVLIALPWAGCFPCGFRSLWPASAPAAGQRRAPSSSQIDAMDQAYAWTALIRDQDERRVVLMRSLMLPPSPSGKPRYVWTWGRLRRATGLHPDTLKKRHAAGICHIVRALRVEHVGTPMVGGRPAARERLAVPFAFGQGEGRKSQE